MNICVIPARGGSKRIPRKNIKEFCGKPIIAYSIESAINSNCFEQVVVSTDDEEIAEVARQYGATVPFIRPADLADDFSTTSVVIKHAIDWFTSNGYTVDDVCCLYATAPFITKEIISQAHELSKENPNGFCISVGKFPYPIQRALRMDEFNRLDMINQREALTRSQDVAESYHDAGQFYWGKASSFASEKQFFSGDSVAFVLPHYLVNDIDTEDDWILAEVMRGVLSQLDLIK